MTNLKSKIIERSKSRKQTPAPTNKTTSKKVAVKKAAQKKVKVKKTPVKKTVRKVKEIQKTFDIAKLKGYRVEYFDDRFYKVILPANVHESFIANIPRNLTEFTGDSIDVYLPSFSTIVGNAEPMPFIAKWRGNVGNAEADRISQVALNKGSNIHNAIELYANGVAIIYQNLKTMNVTDKEIREFKKKNKCQVHLIHSQEEMIQIARYKTLLSVINPKILATEQKVISLEYGYAGTLDQQWNVTAGTYQINSSRTATTLLDGRYIVDFKTGNHFNERHCYTQLAAYLQAHPDRDKIVGGIGVHLNHDIKSGVDGVKIYAKTKEELEPYFEHFLDLKKVYMFTNPVFPKKYDFPLILKRSKK